jgi:lipopolysaccharide transport system ATP-binding protein
VSRREGRTVLFVSHNLAAISELTHRALLIESGRIVIDGPTQEAVSSYLSKGRNAAAYDHDPNQDLTRPHVSRAEVITSEGGGIHQFGKPIELRFVIKHEHPMKKACFSFQIINQFQQAVIHSWAYYPEVQFGRESGETVLTCRIDSLRLNIGQFFLKTYLCEPPGGEYYEKLNGICQFEVNRTGDTILWGWHPDNCAYHEQWRWIVDADASLEEKKEVKVPAR